MYIGLLESGLHIPMKIIPKFVENEVRIPQKSILKDKSKFINIESEYVAHDHNLQLITIEAIE